MGVRETLNKNPGITTGATIAIIVVALIFIIYNSVERTPKPPTEAFYTVDDGTTWFADDIRKIPPFQKDGKEAVRAHIFTCDKGKTKFVAYLEKYTPDAAKKLEAARTQANDPNNPHPVIAEEVAMTGLLVKKPGDKNWVRQTDMDRASKVTELKCPNNGDIKNLEPVVP